MVHCPRAFADRRRGVTPNTQSCLHARLLWYNWNMSPTIETYDDTILANLNGAMTPQAAEGILSLGFSEQQRQRMQDLASKARGDDLTDQEREEANSFERVSSLLGILQSRARLSVKQAAS